MDAVDHAVIIRERHVHDRVNRHQVVALVLDDDDALLDGTETENRDVGLRDDRAADEVAAAAGVRDGERLAGEVVGGEVSRSSSLCDVGDRARDATNGQVVGVADHGDDQALVGVDGDANVDLGELNKRIVQDAGVDFWKLAESSGGRGNGEGEVRQIDALLLEMRFVLTPQDRSSMEITLGKRDHIRRRLFRVDHVVGDDSASTRERDDLIAVLGDVGRQTECSAGTGGARGWLSGPGNGCLGNGHRGTWWRRWRRRHSLR